MNNSLELSKPPPKGFPQEVVLRMFDFGEPEDEFKVVRIEGGGNSWTPHIGENNRRLVIEWLLRHGYERIPNSDSFRFLGI
jgi:hypothetical protein